ncbi:MAG TPA: glycosyltransferase family 9 protein, partial [Isosphaeraceae bacterium]
MTSSPVSPKPVPVRRYRYSKWRWRVLVHAIDAVGGLAMRLARRARPSPSPPAPRRILVVQLDHLGDAVLTSPMLPRLRAAFPAAAIDVLASPSNREVFEADPNVDRVRLADRTWFERSPRRWALGSAVWRLGRTLRDGGYDVGIDVRGDVLTVLVLALAGIPRRVGWAMGGGGFLLTDLARWVPGRHEVASRLALLEPLGIPATGPARVAVHVTDRDRARVARRLRAAWPD